MLGEALANAFASCLFQTLEKAGTRAKMAVRSSACSAPLGSLVRSDRLAAPSSSFTMRERAGSLGGAFVAVGGFSAGWSGPPVRPPSGTQAEMSVPISVAETGKSAKREARRRWLVRCSASTIRVNPLRNRRPREPISSPIAS